jgi:hypothetical protein
MKPLAVLIPLLLTCSALAETPPELSARDVVQIADQSLTSRGLAPKVFIQTVTFQSTALLGGKRTWYVQWSGFVEGSKAGTRETGLQVGMDGHVIHVIKEPGSGPTGSRPR